MPGEAKRREVDSELATSRLGEALDSCRSMIRNYRAMLGDGVLAEGAGDRASQPLARDRRR